MNVLVIACDTLRADHLGCYGYFRETSPNIDSIAKEGVLFEDFFSAAIPTGPSFTCMYTGLYAIHSKYYMFLYPNAHEVDDLTFTMPETLRAFGYTTVAVDNLIDFPPHSKHWVRGYNFYINPRLGDPSISFPLRPANLRAETVNRRLIPWVKSHSNEKFFLLVHYWDPHTPYSQPAEYRNLFQHEKGTLSDLRVEEAPAGYQYVQGWGRVGDIEEERGSFSIDLYDGEIRYMDNAIGEVIDTLKDEGIFEETLIIVTSDHGESLGQHYNSWGHISLHETTTHLPFVMRCPKKLPKGVSIRGFGQHIDMLPTVLDVLGIEANILELDGHSVMPLLNGEEIRDRIFMESSSGQRAIRNGGWKLIDDEWRGKAHRELELYNITEDPMEVINLAESERRRTKELREVLRRWVRLNRNEKSDPAIHRDGGKALKMRIEYMNRLHQLYAMSRKHERSRTLDGAESVAR